MKFLIHVMHLLLNYMVMVMIVTGILDEFINNRNIVLMSSFYICTHCSRGIFDNESVGRVCTGGRCLVGCCNIGGIILSIGRSRGGSWGRGRCLAVGRIKINCWFH